MFNRRDFMASALATCSLGLSPALAHQAAAYVLPKNTGRSKSDSGQDSHRVKFMSIPMLSNSIGRFPMDGPSGTRWGLAGRTSTRRELFISERKRSGQVGRQLPG